MDSVLPEVLSLLFGHTFLGVGGGDFLGGMSLLLWCVFFQLIVFNHFCSELIPGRFSSKQTSPQHSAYPTWAKELCLTGRL